ncbi:SDR family NAD(P)-dependent oxidoreductase [Phytoactinopolyspora limicola]|uniref:SDR family NAD(P)-dependent oxidoreductase n=1 Tax=Phytoactinopolyspora limicola TaxID=2715536 RepID=UPI0014089C09|nr:SDR family oxidoreductase [Phytoactinopolyspora limicola]
MTDWTSKTVVITGAAGGIGSVLSRWYATAGARVALVGRTEAIVAKLAAELRDDIDSDGDVRVSHHAADISDADDVDRLFTDVYAAWGSIDVMVNNAAFAYDEDLLATTPQQWDEQVATTLRGPYLCARAVLPGMRERGNGVILNISSVNAQVYVGNEAYSAAKAGLDSLTRSIAVRYGPDGVRAVGLGVGTVVTPGAWDARIERDPGVLERLTRWYPAGRLGQPDDIAHLAGFVTSDQASWITGTTIMIDGGLTAGNPVMAADILSEV